MKKILFLLMINILLLNQLGNCTDNPDYKNDKAINEILVFKEINLEMVKCPAGSFMMGSPETEEFRQDDENLHKVTITKPFFIGKYEVTQRQYESIIGENPSRFNNDPDKPVELVDWEDAKAFCEKLNHIFQYYIPKGYKFDLPTEAQWEYACRAGTTTSLNNGKNLKYEFTKESIIALPNSRDIAWTNGNSGDQFGGGTHPVGELKPNAWGIYDMHGNVMEWCRDLYGEYPKEEVTDPTGANEPYENFPGQYCGHVIRGGDWFINDWRSARRYADSPSKPYLSCSMVLGFRVALIPVEL